MRLVVLVTILSALALGLAACGGSDLEEAFTTAVPAENAPPDPTIEVSGQVSEECARYGEAYGNLSLNLQLAAQLTSDEQYAQLATNGGPVNLDLEALDRSIETLSELSGIDDQLARMHEIAALLRANVESGTPFADGDDGQRLVDEIRDSFADDLVAITIALQESCAP